jgi:virulence factor
MPKLVQGNKAKIAMIGAGSMANQVHYPSLASLKDVEFAGICDLKQDRLNATGDRYGIEKRYTDYQKMIEEIAPDAVYAIGQPEEMYPVWMWCLQQGLNLYIEKPMGITLHQARSLAYMADLKGCLTQVSFQRRSCPIAVKLLTECLRRGPIVHSVCRFYKCQISPFLNARDHLPSRCMRLGSAQRLSLKAKDTCTRMATPPGSSLIPAKLQAATNCTSLAVSRPRIANLSTA